MPLIFKSITHIFTYTIAFAYMAIFVILGMWVFDFVLNLYDWEMSVIQFLSASILYSALLLPITIPLDLYSLYKDLEICKASGIKFFDFVVKKSSQKREIYEKFK